MLLYNENFQEIDSNALKAELKNELEIETPTEEEVEEDLASYYSKAMALDTASYGLPSVTLKSLSDQSFSKKGIGKKILKKIKEFICGILNEDSTMDQIIDAILTAIAAIIPGGVIIKLIVKKLLKFILSMGVGKFCAI
jgi:hypothetical protein